MKTKIISGLMGVAATLLGLVTPRTAPALTLLETQSCGSNCWRVTLGSVDVAAEEDGFGNVTINIKSNPGAMGVSVGNDCTDINGGVFAECSSTSGIVKSDVTNLDLAGIAIPLKLHHVYTAGGPAVEEDAGVEIQKDSAGFLNSHFSGVDSSAGGTVNREIINVDVDYTQPDAPEGIATTAARAGKLTSPDKSQYLQAQKDGNHLDQMLFENVKTALQVQ